jgi:hypothetical protein
LIVASTLLAGCGQGIVPTTAAAVKAGAVKAASVAARPSLEDAFAAAQRVAAQEGGKPSEVLFVHGSGVGPDGRLLAGEQAWMGGEAEWRFSFKRSGGLFQKGTAELTVHVYASGRVESVKSVTPVAVRPWRFDPARGTTFAEAMRRAIADGLDSPVYTVAAGPQDSVMTGAQSTPYAGPVTYMIAAGDGNVTRHRLVTARSGLVHRQPDAEGLEQTARMMRPVLEKWHLTLTRGEARPVTPEDVRAQSGRAELAELYMRLYDQDRDGRVTLDELIAAHTSPTMLNLWYEMLIERQFYRADKDQNERLTTAEAAKLTYEAVAYGGAVRELPLAVTPEELRAADTDGDGALDLNEYGPLGTRATLRLLTVDSNAAATFFYRTYTKPWSH